MGARFHRWRRIAVQGPRAAPHRQNERLSGERSGLARALWGSLVLACGFIR